MINSGPSLLFFIPLNRCPVVPVFKECNKHFIFWRLFHPYLQNPDLIAVHAAAIATIGVASLPNHLITLKPPSSALNSSMISRVSLCTSHSCCLISFSSVRSSFSCLSASDMMASLMSFWLVYKAAKSPKHHDRDG